MALLRQHGAGPARTRPARSAAGRPRRPARPLRRGDPRRAAGPRPERRCRPAGLLFLAIDRRGYTPAELCAAHPATEAAGGNAAKDR
ncbi:MAG: hypothetical protein FJ265_13730 [Planctomycetes bacterium]|nr:hypothetical protein [Planctomycetota bacterium]